MKDRHNKTPLGLVCLAVFAVSGVIAVSASEAQAQEPSPPKTYHFCYVPQSGAVYIIKEPGMPEECRNQNHVQFSWTEGTPDHSHGNLNGLEADDHNQYLLRSEAPDGYSLDAADGDPVDAVYVDDEGDVTVGGTVTAAAFVGDGSGLTGLNGQPGALDLVIVSAGPNNAGTDGVVSRAAASVDCPVGYFPMNAGYRLISYAPDREKLIQTMIRKFTPAADGSWGTEAWNPDPTFTDWSLVMSVICVRQAN